MSAIVMLLSGLAGHVRDPYFTINDLRVMGAGVVAYGLRYPDCDEATAPSFAFW
jgi:hypothetical protein